MKCIPGISVILVLEILLHRVLEVVLAVCLRRVLEVVLDVCLHRVSTADGPTLFLVLFLIFLVCLGIQL